MILDMRLVVGSLALLIAVNAAAQIYRWTDEKGRVVYGNEPPSGTNPSVVQERINSYSGPPEVRRAPPASTPVTAAPVATTIPVVMYATSWCGYCAQARAHFARRGIAYIEYDVEKSPAAHAEFKRLGGRGVPLIVHGANVMRGFREQSFDALLARNGK
ncbi:MAG TPA: glutaredoxin family protein [Burkholderiales bacterium]|nr:glutaredoxin family protein [Burkholderiales bacterium]